MSITNNLLCLPFKFEKRKIITRLLLSSVVVGAAICSTHAEGENKKSHSYQHASDYGLSNKDLGFGGEYVGLTGGAELGKSSVNSNAQATNDVSLSSRSDLSHRGLSGGIVAGYGKTIKGIYVGAEVAGELSNANGKNSFTTNNGAQKSGTVSVKKNDSVSIAARVGKQIDNKTLIYAKAGLASNGYRFGSSISSDTDGASATKNVRLLQPIAGIGVERKVAKVTPKIDLHLGVEYEKTFGRTTNVGLSSDTATGNSKFDTSSDAIKARILFKF